MVATRSLGLFVCLCLQLEGFYRELRHPFIWKQQLGWVTSSPADVGTGLRIRVHLKLQHLPKHRRLQDVLKRLRICMDRPDTDVSPGNLTRGLCVLFLNIILSIKF